MSEIDKATHEFVLLREGTVSTSRSVDPDEREYMLQAFTELRHQAEPGDVISLVVHQAPFCMCPDELGMRNGCVILSEHTVS